MQDTANALVTGEITAKFYDQTTLTKFERNLNKLIEKWRKKFPKLIKWYRLGKLKKVDKRKNVICNAGFNVLARLLCNDTTYSGYINDMALGTGAPTPAASDTTLDTESYRNTTASYTADANIAYLTAFYSETECNGTYTEFGNFIDGDGTGNPDTGKLWSHIAGISWEKDSNTVLVISCRYTFASA